MPIVRNTFRPSNLPGRSREKTALLLNPPVYDTQYWAEWSQPYGLLRIATLLRKSNYKRVELFDFMETDERRQVHKHRINAGEDYSLLKEPDKIPVQPLVVEKDGQQLELYKFHFGKTWDEFEKWIEVKGFSRKHPPTEIWVSATMTYWWESCRDLIARCRHYFGKRPRIILGGIYPTLVPEHALHYCKPDLVVAGEVEEANDLWIDLSLYDKTPTYSIVTPSRGCPFDCHYCAAKTINGGVQKARFRNPQDVVAEMRNKYERHGIRDFAFYADFLLIGFKNNLMPVLRQIADEKLPFRLNAPEGLDTNFLTQDEHLLPLMKEAGFQKIYLPCESIDDQHLKALNRRHVRLEHFVKAARMCERVGFRLRNLEVNAFLLYGLPGEKIDHVVKSILFVSEMVGSIIPMLFAPVPSTAIYDCHLDYFKKCGWDKDLHKLNGKLYPFLQMNEGSVQDYVDLQRLMYMLNAHYRSRSFSVYGETRVSQSFRENVSNGFGHFVNNHKHISLEKEPLHVLQLEPIVKNEKKVSAEVVDSQEVVSPIASVSSNERIELKTSGIQETVAEA